MAAPTRRNWSTVGYSTGGGTTGGTATVTGSDYPQVGDYIMAVAAYDNASANSPNVSAFSVSGAGAVGAWSILQLGAPVANASGSVIVAVGFAKVTTAFTSASRIDYTLDASSPGIRTACATAVTGASSAAFGGSSNTSGTALGGGTSDTITLLGAGTEQNTAPTIFGSGGTVCSVGSTGGGSASNCWGAILYALNPGASVGANFSDGGEGAVVFTGSTTPSYSGTVALSGDGTLSTGASAPNAKQTATLTGSGSLTTGGSAPAASGAATLSGTGSLSTGTPVPAIPGTAALSGDGTLQASGSGSQSASGAAAMSGDGTLTATGAPSGSDAAALSGEGTLTASGSGGGGGGGGPYRMYEASSPPSASAADYQGLTVGVEIYVTSDCELTEIRWWQPSSGAQVDSRTARVWQRADGVALGTTPTVAPSGSGWQTLTFATPVALTANTRYMVGVYHPGGGYAATGAYYAAGSPDEVNGPLVIPNGANATGAVQGGYMYGGGLAMPTNTYNSTNYWVDVTVATAGGGSAFTGAVALSGEGTLSAGGGVPGASGSAAFSGDGTLSTVGSAPAASRTVPLSGSGVLTVAAAPGTSASVPLSGDGTLTLTGSGTAPGTASLNGNGVLTLAGNGTAPGTVSLSGQGVLSLTGRVSSSASVPLSGDGVLSFATSFATTYSVPLYGDGSLSLTGGGASSSSGGGWGFIPI